MHLFVMVLRGDLRANFYIESKAAYLPLLVRWTHMASRQANHEYHGLDPCHDLKDDYAYIAVNFSLLE